MNKYLLLTLIALVGVTSYLFNRNKRLAEDLNFAEDNVMTLMRGVKNYKTKDSLNAVEVLGLTLDLQTYKQNRAADLATIETLRLKNRQLERISSTQTETVYDVQTEVRDSVVYVDSSKYEYRCFDYKTDYATINGCILGKQFTGSFVSRDSLLYVESIEYKKFLGFLWRTNKIKDRKQDILSKNPNTQILNAEFISIKN